jgi:hypothetical protein
MAKTKTFAEKMLKSNKPKQEFDHYKVIRGVVTGAGAVRYESKVVKVRKGESEKKTFGL